MPEQALYLKWRPQTFDEVIGQEHITRTLKNSVKHNRRRNAYLFSGIRGTGKTTLARILARALNCERPGECVTCQGMEARSLYEKPCGICKSFAEGNFLDLIEIDAASNTGVDDVRDLQEKIRFAPVQGSLKVYVIDEVHRFSKNAFDALLKTIEEPPDHALFILATTEIDKVPPTIKSRCAQFQLRRVPLDKVTARLEYIAEQEGLMIEEGVLPLVARMGEGSVRDSISLLDQIVTVPEEIITLQFARDMLGISNSIFIAELVEALAAEDAARGLHIINQALVAGSEPRQFGNQVVDYLRNVLLAQTASADLIEATPEEQARYSELAQSIARTRLLKALRAFNEAAAEYKIGWQPQLLLELAWLETLHQEAPAPAPAAAPAPAPSRPQPRSAAAQSDPTQKADAFQRAQASPPGEPPIYPVAKIHQGWMDILKQVHRYHRNMPSLLEHAHVRAIAGNRLILGVQNDIFQQKISDAKRAGILEQAIQDLHGVKLIVEVRVVDSVAAPEDSAASDSQAFEDPLVAAGRELGGVVEG